MLTSHQTVDHATKAPYIATLGVGDLEENFGCDVWEGSGDAFALCLSSQLGRVGELSDSGTLVFIVKKDVIRLYVSVDDRVVM